MMIKLMQGDCLELMKDIHGNERAPEEIIALVEVPETGKQYSQQTIHGMCTDLGLEISYLDDVIEMLEKVRVEG